MPWLLTTHGENGGLNKALWLLMASPASHVTDLWAPSKQMQPHMQVGLHYTSTQTLPSETMTSSKTQQNEKHNQKFSLAGNWAGKACVWELHLIRNLSHNTEPEKINRVPCPGSPLPGIIIPGTFIMYGSEHTIHLLVMWDGCVKYVWFGQK